MIKLLTLILILAMAVVFGGDKRIAWAADLCGGTGGNGQIVSISKGEFTMKRNDDGSNQVVHLTSQATIKTNAGLVTLPDLKVGDRVTLVGGPNRDGSFSADYVVVCAETQENQIDQTVPSSAREENTNYKKVSNSINIVIFTLVGLVWVNLIAYLRLFRKMGFAYLLFFTMFYVYLYKVLDYTLIQFQSLIVLKHYVPNLMLNGAEPGKAVNFIPLATLTTRDVKTSLLNILMMMPFGFGLPFVTNFRIKKTVMVGIFLSMAIEILQLITGFLANTTFRIADVNDLIFNTMGVAVGFILFIWFGRIYLHIFRNSGISTNPILRYIEERAQIGK